MLNLFTLSFIGSVFFGITLILIHVIRKDLQFAKYALSIYALGDRGWLLSLGLYSIGFAQILLALGLAISDGVSLSHILLILAGMGAIVVAVFKVELPNKTIKGYLHDIGAGMQFIFFPISLLLMSHFFLNSKLFYITLVIGYINLLLLIVISYVYFTGSTHKIRFFGYIQKTNIILMNIWVVITSFTLM